MKNRNVPVLMVFILGFTSFLVQAQIYSWVDEKGVKHYSDTPPADAGVVRDVQTVETDAGESGGEMEVPMPSMPETAVKPAATHRYPAVKMFTTQWCPACKFAKDWFKEHRVPFQEIDVEASPENKNQFRALGGKAVPLILVGKNRMVGLKPGDMRVWLGMD